MTDIKALVERLSKVESNARPYSVHNEAHTCWYRNPDGPEAAQAISTLLSDNERLRDLLKSAVPYVDSAFGQSGSNRATRLLFAIDQALSPLEGRE